MKKFLLSMFLFVFMFGGIAEAGRNGIQFSSEGNVNFIHYGDNYEWAAGVGLGYDEQDNDVNDDVENFAGGNLDWDTDSFNVGVFARKNFKIHEKTYAALGLWGQWAWGDTEDPTGVLGVVDFDRYSISPYMLVEYHLTDHLFLSAGAEIVNFSHTDYDVEIPDYDDYEYLETDKTTFFEPFIGLAYVF